MHFIIYSIFLRIQSVVVWVNEQLLLLGYIYDILTFEYKKLAFNGTFQLGERKNCEIILQVGGPELKRWNAVS